MIQITVLVGLFGNIDMQKSPTHGSEVFYRRLMTAGPLRIVEEVRIVNKQRGVMHFRLLNDHLCKVLGLTRSWLTLFAVFATLISSGCVGNHQFGRQPVEPAIVLGPTKPTVHIMPFMKAMSLVGSQYFTTYH